jgi:hypothetical protein
MKVGHTDFSTEAIQQINDCKTFEEVKQLFGWIDERILMRVYKPLKTKKGGRK